MSLQQLLLVLPAVLISITVHEFSHGYMAYKLGDPTARNLGRLTLNPLKHLDFVGTLMLIFARFGWAKPVPINPMYFDNIKRGTVLVGLAGPLSNFVLALIVKAISISAAHYYIDNLFFLYVFLFLQVLYIININLAAFNLIPIPPLDGSKIFGGLLPKQHYYKLLNFERYIGIILIFIVFLSPRILTTIMSPITWALDSSINMLLLPLNNILQSAFL